ncbi:MAG TPA: protein kinase [Pyrinomonadaceae bacterium]|jgi:serine/threonine protein kinase/TolB-like protein/Flp pilus assembly protein TadD
MERWEEIDRVLQSVLERAPDERRAFLNEVCADDEQLRRGVLSVLDSYERAGSFMERPAIEEGAQLFADETDGLREGDVVGQYKIIRQLGRGGMGEVYLAHDVKLGRTVALKVLPHELASDRQRMQRFEQEAKTASSLNHPNILTIFEIGEADSRRFIATEYIDGVTLRRHLCDACIKLHEVLDIAIQMAAALDAAHEVGVVHRDIKPENVMVRRRDRIVKVLDFGLAKLLKTRAAAPMASDPDAPTQALIQTEPGMVMGTVAYMSPEQSRGLEVDARTDIWSLGVVLYEMLTGRVPFEGQDVHRQVIAIQEQELAPLSQSVEGVPEELERIVKKALAKDADERYQTAKDLLIDLRSLRKRLELDAEIERSLSPEQRRASQASAGDRTQRAGVGTAEQAAQTTVVTGERTWSSAEYIKGSLKRHKAGAVLALALLILTVAALVFGLYNLARPNKTPAETNAREPASAVPSTASGSAQGIKTLAVLPFKPLSGKSQDQVLEIGMTDALITKLSNVRQIVVRPTSAVLKYVDFAKDSLAAGREQGVDSILEGKVQRSGDKIRVTVQMVRVSDGTPLWAETFDGKFTDIFVVQDSISERVAAALQLELTGEERGNLAKRYTESTEAYQLYLKGRYVWSQFTPASHLRAIKYLEQAIAHDPDYALAYAGLADAYSASASNSWLPPHEAMPKAKRAALKAIEIDDSLGEAHAALGGISMFYEWDWAAAERELKQAISLNANYPPAHQLYAFYLTARGRFDEAVAEAEQAHQIDPLSPKMYGDWASAYHTARRYDRAIELAREALEIDPNFPANHAILGWAYEQKGMYEDAIAEFQKGISLTGRIPIVLSALGHVYSVAGKRREALEILDELKEISRREPISPYDFAVSYIGLGEYDKAFEQLDKAFEERSSRLIWLKVDQYFDPLRSDPRFLGLLQRMKLTS